MYVRLLFASLLISSMALAQNVQVPARVLTESPHSELLTSRVARDPTFQKLSRAFGTNDIQPLLTVKRQWRNSLKVSDFEPAGPRDVVAKLSASIANQKERETFAAGAQQLLDATQDAAPRKNNLAVAMGLLFISALHVVTPDHEFSDRESDLVFKAINDAFALTPGFARVSNQERTQMHDLFIVTGTTLSLAQETAKLAKDKKGQENAVRLAREVLTLFGVNR